MRGKRLSIGLRAALAIFTVTLLVTNTWAATNWTEKVLHSFNQNNTGGVEPLAGLIFDAAGNLYGTTNWGGTYGGGTVFELTPTAAGGWAETVLHSFGNGTDGAHPLAGLIFDAAGNLYGTTYYGGASQSCQGGSSPGCGTVFELMPTGAGGWTEKVLHNFNNDGTNGWWPRAGLITDAAGNLYGTTSAGGLYGRGIVFELTPSAGAGWTEKVLYSFNSNGADGHYPYAGLIFDAAGNLYGTTMSGGLYGRGTVFELTATAGGGWTEKVLYSFNSNGTDGHYPYAGLIFDAAGNLYGTTNEGGTYLCAPHSDGCGTVFELTPEAGGGWTEQVLHRFGNSDGALPVSGSLIFDSAGNLYGTTVFGGDYLCGPYGDGCGTVFELTPKAGGGWTEQVLHSFNNNDSAVTNGWWPWAGLITDTAGNLYGTTMYSSGIAGSAGTVFQLTPPVYPCTRCGPR